MTAPNLNSCLASCQEEEDCKYFTYHHFDNECSFTSACDFVDETCSSCVHGQSSCRPREVNTKLLVAGGLDDDGEKSAAVSIIDLDTGKVVDGECGTIPDLPEPMVLSIGALVDEKPIICGGQESRNCYIFEPSTKRWVMDDSFGGERYGASSLVINDSEWWIAGGFQTSFQDTSLIYRVSGFGCFNVPNTGKLF